LPDCRSCAIWLKACEVTGDVDDVDDVDDEEDEDDDGVDADETSD
jgi:hypothetical protein